MYKLGSKTVKRQIAEAYSKLFLCRLHWEIHDSSPSFCQFLWQILNKGNLLQFDWATKKRRKHLQLSYIQKFWTYVDSISNILIDSWTYTLFFPWQTPTHNNRFISFRPFWCCCFMNGGWWWWLVVCSLEQWRDLLALHTYPAALACSTFANTGFTNIELYYYCKYKIYRAYRLYCRALHTYPAGLGSVL